MEPPTGLMSYGLPDFVCSDPLNIELSITSLMTNSIARMTQHIATCFSIVPLTAEADLHMRTLSAFQLILFIYTLNVGT